MPEQKPEVPKPEPDRLVEALVPDPTAGPPNATVLHGYVGTAPSEDMSRLYLTAALDTHVDIPAEEILHSQKLPDDRGTLLWVRRDARLNYTHTSSQQVQADFLEGLISQTYLGGVSGASAKIPGVPHPPLYRPFELTEATVYCMPSLFMYLCPTMACGLITLTRRGCHGPGT